MDCRILRHVTLKSDGHLACDDSMGYGIDLGSVSDRPGWKLRDVFNAPVYRHVRSAFARGEVPWPGVCEGCDLFSAAAQPTDTLDTRFELLVEPTLACHLSCACCLRKQIIAKGRDTSMLDPRILRQMMQSAKTDNFLLDQVHYIGWGEPLLHPDFRELVDTVYEFFPETTQMVTTTGNVDFQSTIGVGKFDRIVCSCDGVTETSYTKYRKGGEFKTALKFMADAKKYGHPSTFLEWKYILFEFNDSDEDILEAQRIADDIGVDSLLFIITNSKWHSERFDVTKSHMVPLKSPAASISPAAAMNTVAATATLFGVLAENFFGHIDRCTISEGHFLTVEGWAFEQSGHYTKQADLYLDDTFKARVRPSLKRLDVHAVHVDSAGPNCGFRFSLPIDTTTPPRKIEIRLGQDGISSWSGNVHWKTPESNVKRRKDFTPVNSGLLA